ncbi:MAG: D-alanine--D-alanine ligase [Geodermatophilaceae bacterium]|nr:D-alanine--D-alanine ligase [Geodermatophilaceae bacterium]
MTQRSPRAVVVSGGLAYEREVSLRSGRRVAEALRHAGVETVVVDADADLLPSLAADPADALFIALHGAAGEDGSLRSVLELAGVPFVGTPADRCRIAWDKPSAKAAVRAAGHLTPDWVALPHSTFRELGAGAVLDLIVSRLGLPLMVKPTQGGSALGVERIGAAADLPSAMVSCFAYGDTVLIERFVAGTEVAVSVLDAADGPQALPAVEIAPSSGVFDYAARYTAGMTAYHTPARLPTDVSARVGQLAVAVHRALGLRDLSRTDAIVDPDGGVHFLEVNVSPGMTETSMLPMSVSAAGWDLGQTLRDMIATAAARAATESTTSSARDARV